MATRVAGSFDDVIAQTEAALKEQGFGIVTRIDIQGTLKSKLGADFRPYMILGACNPRLAYEALQLEARVGTMLPCNVVVQQSGADCIEVAAIDPVASMQAIDNSALSKAAHEVRTMLAKAIDSLAA